MRLGGSIAIGVDSDLRLRWVVRAVTKINPLTPRTCQGLHGKTNPVHLGKEIFLR